MALSPPSIVNVISYNLLSSSLAMPSFYPTYNPETLKAENRFALIRAKLEEQIAKRAIIALQEVSITWAGQLDVLFEKHGYHFVHNLYGNRFNGYMGIGLAWPLDLYEAVDVSLQKIAESKTWPRVAADVPFWPSFGLVGRFLGSVSSAWERFARPEVVALREDWAEIKRRSNVLIFARLRVRPSGKVFCVATYHMPCAFRQPRVVSDTLVINPKSYAFDCWHVTLMCWP